MLDGLLSFLRLLFSTLRRSGGLIQVSKTTWNIYRRRGIQGVRKKIGTLLNEFSHSGHSDIAGHSYSEWIRRYDSPSDLDLKALRLEMENFEFKPLISIIMPCYDPHLSWLEQAIDSVRSQEYTNWQLCVADDCSSDPEVINVLNRYAAADSRINVVAREVNGHISAASNSALEMAAGDWVALLDHDDTLSSLALFYVVQSLNANPSASLIYSDEDKLSDSGQRFSPYFKSNWNPDAFYCHNIICHLGVYRRALLIEVGGFREGFEGAQDYDLALRFIERIPANEIVHIPRVLYHWRSHSQSTALSVMAKPYTIDAGVRALNEHFLRSGITASAEESDSGYVTRYPLPAPAPSVSIILLAGKDPESMRQFVSQVQRLTDYEDYEIILVCSNDFQSEWKLFTGESAVSVSTRLLEAGEAAGTGARLNLAGELSACEVLVFLGQGVEPVSSDWLTNLVGLTLSPLVGAVGPKIISRDGKIVQGGYVFGMNGEPLVGQSFLGMDAGSPGYFGRLCGNSTVAAVSLSCMAIQRKSFLTIGGFDQLDFPGVFQDVDFCLRLAENGLRNVWSAQVEMYLEPTEENQADDEGALIEASVDYMRQKWRQHLNHDPIYSPNLGLKPGSDIFAWPPRYSDVFRRYQNNDLTSRTAAALATAIVIHVFYLEIFEELFALLNKVDVQLKIFVTSPEALVEHIEGMLLMSGFEFEVHPVENRGRDILPFLLMLPRVIAEEFEIVLKLHTKKSVTREDGDNWRTDIFGQLLGSGAVREVADYCQQNSSVGMIGPTGHLVPLSNHWGRNRSRVSRLATEMGISGNRLFGQVFVAGSMFYARPSALQPLMALGITANEFEIERGQTDGTMAHVVERLFAVSVTAAEQVISDMRLADGAVLANRDYDYSDG